MFLVDTSVWIDHLRRDNAGLRALLYDGAVLAHPFVLGELACGTLQKRDEILGDLAALPQAQVAEHEEVLQLVARERLYGRGIGWVDAHLLSSALLTNCGLWSLDKTLSEIAQLLRIPQFK